MSKKHLTVEEELQDSELRYRRLFETAQDGILILEADSGKITDANPFLMHLLGYLETELLGKQLWEIGVFKDIVDSKAAFLELQTKGYIRYKDLPLQTKTGKSIDVEFISNVYAVDHHKVIQCNIRDITNRKKVEKAIKLRTKELEDLNKAMLNVMEDLEAAKKLLEIAKAKDEAILASIGEGLIAVDNDRKILVINRVAEEMFGVQADEVIGKEITSIPSLADEAGNILPANERPTYEAVVKNRQISGIYYFVKKDNTKFPVAITVTPIKLGKKTIGALDIFRDITREKEVDKAKSEFVSLASHQLRTPLGIIKWYLEALEGEDYIKNAPDVVRKYFDQIHKSNERVLSLVRNLLSVSRIEQGGVKNTLTLVNISQMVKEIVEQMKIIACKKQIIINLTIQDNSIPTINIDSLRLHEVIENLICNAIEYTLDKGLIEVILKKTDDLISIGIKDTGIGIPESDQKKLFTKFFRSEKAIGFNSEGSGLGLYVVKSYVEGWGGTISVQSKEGVGSTFTINIPIVQKKI